ncbi:Thiol-disulfide isomerase/thioredoxin-like protein [Fulvivirga imtechensis AK7]|uniref:Thiol-disulfide isomerase/thioredoxin-like protein n=1 Tax=Fulvivirga imtechensis AK7 TaxID=1237149 RepID=L8JPL0_9BACT|nr:TlpA disulfide reductase family protein [Fulvivirga imtechensis]ELR69302.1 Thiol-disulfide isomerase/thioredoxin-like protein [Fulvivirga imtechensis AK7]
MRTKSFIWGLLAGMGIFLIPIIGFFIYTTTVLGPELEKLTQELDPPKHLYTRLNETLTLVPVSGDSTSIALQLNVQSKPIIVNHWATWCKPCILEMESFERLHSRLGSEVEFYFLSNEPAETQKQLIDKKGWQLPFYHYSDSLPKDLSFKQLPTTYIIKNGVIYYKHVGKADWNSDVVVDFIRGLGN